MKPQLIQRRVIQARRDLADEFEKLGQTAKAQMTGVEKPAIGASEPKIPDPNQFPSTEAMWAEEQKKNEERMRQLRVLINQIREDESKARQQKLKQEQAWQKAQEEMMQAGKPKEEKKGFIGIISRASKRLKGRLGQIGKGKMEKGRAAAG